MSLLFQILSVIVLFQMVFISFFLFTTRKGRPISNRLLSFFFLSLAAGLIDFILIKTGMIHGYHQYAFFLNLFVLFHPPLLLLYVWSLTRPSFKLSSKHLWHTSAFFLAVSLLIPFYYLQDGSKQQQILEGSIEGEATVFIVIYLLGLLYVLGYLIAIKIELKKYRIRIKTRFSNLDRINLRWLNYMVNIFIGAFLVNTLASFIRHTSSQYFDELAIISSLLAFFFFINSVLMKGLHSNEFFLGSGKYDDWKPIQSTAKQDYIDRLRVHLEKEKPFLDPDLTIDMLAIQVKIPVRELSTLINKDLDKSFYDLINQKRIEEAGHLLRDHSDNRTISEVMYSVGFNSKSSFNSAFKKFTGLTPSEFKSQMT